MTELQQLKKEHNLKLKENRETAEIIKRCQERIEKNWNELYCINDKIRDLKHEALIQKSVRIRLPRLAMSKKTYKLLHSNFYLEYYAIKKTFFHVLEMYSGQWILRIFGIVYKNVKGAEPRHSRTKDGYPYTEYLNTITSFFEVYREYEDGRCFKSTRPKSSGFFLTFDNTPEKKYRESNRAIFTHQRWRCKWGQVFLYSEYHDDPALANCDIPFIYRDYPMADLVTYKSSKLCRQLMASPLSHLAFNKRVLKVKGDSLNYVKNFYIEMLASKHSNIPIVDVDFLRIAKHRLTVREFFFSKFTVKEVEKLTSLCSKKSLDIDRVKNYLWNQSEGTVQLYSDYIDMLDSNGYGFSYSLYYPRSLRIAHDAMVNHASAEKLYAIEVERSPKEKEILSLYLKNGIIERFIDGVLIKPFYLAEHFNKYGAYLRHCYKDSDSYFNNLVNGSRFMLLLLNAVTKEPLSVATVDFKNFSITYNNGKNDKSVREFDPYVADYILEMKKEVNRNVINVSE